MGPIVHESSVVIVFVIDGIAAGMAGNRRLLQHWPMSVRYSSATSPSGVHRTSLTTLAFRTPTTVLAVFTVVSIRPVPVDPTNPSTVRSANSAIVVLLCDSPSPAQDLDAFMM